MISPKPKPRRIVFLTGTRADFGKLKPLMLRLHSDPYFEVYVFVTGMHMLSKYGSTWEEVRKAGLDQMYCFINQNESNSMDHILAKTVLGFSDYVREITPDMIVIHGDRVEALAGAIVGTLNNIRVAHIEGGEVSGTVDEAIRHSVSKLSHIHFVANEQAKRRLHQLGEMDELVHVIGSPEVDVMNSPDLPALEEVKQRYNISFERYAVLIFHPVTTESEYLREQINFLVDAVIECGEQFVVLYPNNDHGSSIIIEEYERLKGNLNMAVYPSMRFEYFLTLMKHANYVIGNSSSGIREAPYFGVPTINLGSRQTGRVVSPSVMNVSMAAEAIKNAIREVRNLPRQPQQTFGSGQSAEKFHNILFRDSIWNMVIQKRFVDFV